MLTLPGECVRSKSAVPEVWQHGKCVYSVMDPANGTPRDPLLFLHWFPAPVHHSASTPGQSPFQSRTMAREGRCAKAVHLSKRPAASLSPSSCPSRAAPEALAPSHKTVGLQLFMSLLTAHSNPELTAVDLAQIGGSGWRKVEREGVKVCRFGPGGEAAAGLAAQAKS